MGAKETRVVHLPLLPYLTPSFPSSSEPLSLSVPSLGSDGEGWGTEGVVNEVNGAVSVPVTHLPSVGSSSPYSLFPRSSRTHFTSLRSARE